MSVLFDPSLIIARSITLLALVLDASVKGLVVISAASVLCLALRRASAASRHLILSLAMVSLIVLPVLSALLPALQIPILPRPALQLGGGSGSGVPPDETPALPVALQYSEPASAETGDQTEISAERRRRSKIGDHVRNHWPAWVLSVWALGAVVALAPLLIGMVGVWRRARRAKPITEGVCATLLPKLSEELGVRSRVRLLESDDALMPTTWGVVHPVVLLPSDAQQWLEEKYRIVLLHELAHIRRRDWLAQTLARVACSLHWFNPLAWVAARRLRVESEQACDDSVLRAGYKASGYADQLLGIVRSMARSRCASLATVPIVRSSRIERRVAALLDATRNRRALTRLSIILALIAVTCTVLPLAALRPTTRSAEAEAHSAAAQRPRPMHEVTTTDADLSDAARRGIRARAEYLGSKQVRIEYTHTIERDAGQPPLRYDCTLLAHGGNYREERKDAQGRTVHYYFYDGLRVEIGQSWRGRTRRQGSDELVETTFLMGLPPADATDVVAVAPRVSYHPYFSHHIVDGTVVEQLTEPRDSYFAEMERRGAVKADQVVDGIRCVQFDDDREARYYAPDLGWALVGTGPQIGSYRATDFKKTGNVYFPRRIARGPSGRGRETVEIKNIAIADGSLSSPDLLVPPREPEEGGFVEVLCPVVQGSEVIVEERGMKLCHFRWSRDLSPEHRRILAVSMSRWRMRDFEETLDTGFPLPFYDEERNQIVWAKLDRDLRKYLRIHEGDAPDRFGVPPWNDLLYLVPVDSDQENVSRASSAAEGQADHPENGPWLEYRLVSQTPVPGYKQVTSPEGETYYCAPTSFLDPLGFADVLPASNGNGLTIVLTPAAAKRLGEVTSEHVGDSIGLFVDGELVRGPIVIGEPLMGRGKRFSLSPQLGDEIDDSLIRAWSAPVDTSPGRHKLYIHGIGTIETELHTGSPGDFQFLHEGSVYCLPAAFAARPELNPKEKPVQEAVIREDCITAGDERFATVQEALAYIKNQAGPERLVLVTISKEQADTWPQARLTELMPLMHYVHSHPPYVGLRQRMPEGWAWPTKENALEAVAQPDEGERAEPPGADLTREIDSSVAEPAREAPYDPARFFRETLEPESLRDSLDNLSDMKLFDLLPTRDDMRLGRFPLEPDEGRFDIRCILGNKRVLKLLKELAELPKAEAGALVQEHLRAALSEYQSAFHERFGPDKIGPPRRVKPGESAGPLTYYTRRYEILSLAFIAGHLELESTFPAVLELAQYAREQREYVYQCYLTDKIPEFQAYSLLADCSLYNRLVICTALLRTRGGERQATSAEKPRGRSITFITQKVPAYDAFLVPRDPKRWPPEPMEPKIEVTFIRAFTDDGFDRVLAEVTK